MEMDWGFTGDDDFGLAKSFTDAPLHQISPALEGKSHLAQDPLKDAEKARSETIHPAGFDFQMPPVEDVSIAWQAAARVVV